jgi:hypothetical protein
VVIASARQLVIVGRPPASHREGMRTLLRLLPVAAWLCALAATAADEPKGACCRVIELRQYDMKPGGRDVLIDLFEDVFLDPLEALGMPIAGTFRDAQKPDRFVWIRGFADMQTRATQLDAFYTGALWKQHREKANATMVDVGNVLLLRPAGEGAGFKLPAREGTDAARPARVVVATVHSFEGPVPADFPAWFQREAAPIVAKGGAPVLGQFVTETAPNSYPRLPIREGENVFVWFAAYRDLAAASAPLEGLAGWRERVEPKLRSATKGAGERIVLQPTQRSLLR